MTEPTTGATAAMYWTATDANNISCIGATEDGRLFDYTVRNAFPVRPYEPGGVMASLDAIAACHRVAAALQAVLDYDTARNSSEGIHAAHFAAQKPLQALKSGDVETVLAMGRDR